MQKHTKILYDVTSDALTMRAILDNIPMFNKRSVHVSENIVEEWPYKPPHSKSPVLPVKRGFHAVICKC
ncbi:MAG: hypothetical protein ACI88A_001517 [Paraglaciecola sp.]|jgi:hypothetical protein